VLISGCIFSTRESEDPTGAQVPQRNPTSPDSVLYNIREAMKAKSAPIYVQSIAETLLVVPSAADIPLINDPNRFTNWTRDDELDAFTSIFADKQQANVVVTMTFGNIEPPQGIGDEVYYEDLSYQLKFTRGAADTTISGRVDLYLKQTGGRYHVTRWIDIRDSDNATMCLIRHRGQVIF